MAEPFIGEIRFFPYKFAPQDWAKCDGQILKISDHQALYSLIGNKYGGNGTSDFALPDYRGRVPINWGDASWRSFPWASRGGVESNTMTLLPAHRHTFYVMGKEGTENEPQDRCLAAEVDAAMVVPELPYSSRSDTTMHPEMVKEAGSLAPQPFTNVQPFQVLNFCIALKGLYPPRS